MKIICQREVGTKSDGRQPLNIVIIGPPGCGKSSLLNTIFASFSDEKWKELAEHGDSGELGRQTSRFLIYKNKMQHTSNFN
jgi:predicted GTPase